MATPGNYKDNRTKRFLVVPRGTGRVHGHKLELGRSPGTSPRQHLYNPPSCFHVGTGSGSRLPLPQLLERGGEVPKPSSTCTARPPSRVPPPHGQHQRQGAGSGAVWVRHGGRKPVVSWVSYQRAAVPNPSLSDRSSQSRPLHCLKRARTVSLESALFRDFLLSWQDQVRELPRGAEAAWAAPPSPGQRSCHQPLLPHTRPLGNSTPLAVARGCGSPAPSQAGQPPGPTAGAFGAPIYLFFSLPAAAKEEALSTQSEDALL